MKVQLELSLEELAAACECLERRYRELSRKIREGDRKGRSIHRYREEALLLGRVIEELRHAKGNGE